MNKCPYCDAMAETVWDEIAHMERMHPDIIAERLRNAGIDPPNVTLRRVALEKAIADKLRVSGEVAGEGFILRLAAIATDAVLEIE